ncbi:hypothetical protein GCM10027269_41340 [Kribbella endophytica]
MLDRRRLPEPERLRTDGLVGSAHLAPGKGGERSQSSPRRNKPALGSRRGPARA